MDPDSILREIKLNLAQFWIWLRHEITTDPSILLLIIGILLFFWWFLKPK